MPGASRLLLTPACSRAIDIRVPGLSCPQPWGSDTTPGIISSLTSTGTSISPAVDETRATEPSVTPLAAASSGWINKVQRSFPLTRTFTLCIQELLERT